MAGLEDYQNYPSHSIDYDDIQYRSGIKLLPASPTSSLQFPVPLSDEGWFL